MKNFLLFLLLSAIIFSSCKKDNAVYAVADPNSLDGATIISTGKISFSDERYDEGLVKIYIRKDGVPVLALEQMNYQSLFDTNVYLSSTQELATTSIKIFSAKKLHGNIYHPLSSGINAPALKYLIIQGDTDAGAVASAILE
ncbi:MAG: hypothetical protein ABJC98_21170 [Bacteroidota bacterium]